MDSKLILKHKPLDSAEAIVTGYKPGTGKYKGMVGALNCDWNGVAITIGTGLTDADRKSPPKVGAKITFTYNGVTDDGNPRFPAYSIERNYE